MFPQLPGCTEEYTRVGREDCGIVESRRRLLAQLQSKPQAAAAEVASGMQAGLLVLGVEGASWRVMKPYLELGLLPNFAKIKSRGASGDLLSSQPPHQSTAWTSLMTGLGPEVHGVFPPSRNPREGDQVGRTPLPNLQGFHLLRVFGRRGWSVAGFNLPQTYPAFPVPGYLVSGPPMPEHGKQNCYPKAWLQQLSQVQGREYRPTLDIEAFLVRNHNPQDPLAAFERLRFELFRREKERIEAMEMAMELASTDLFVGALSLVKDCQTYFWKFQDRRHQDWTEEGQKRLGLVVLEAYRLADTALGRLCDAVRQEEKDLVVAVVSGLGYGPSAWEFHVNRWLEEEGFLRYRPLPRWEWGRKRIGKLLRRWRLSWLGKILPKNCHSWRLLWPQRRTHREERDIDWSRTVAFGGKGGICLNLQGREPAGIVHEGTERHALTLLLRLKLKAIPVPWEENRKAFLPLDARKQVIGHRLQDGPDVILESEDYSIPVQVTHNAGESFRQRPWAGPSASPHRRGMFLLAGPPIRNSQELPPAKIEAVLPTLLTAAGEFSPRYLQGEGISLAFRKDGVPLRNSSKKFSAVEEKLYLNLRNSLLATQAPTPHAGERL